MIDVHAHINRDYFPEQDVYNNFENVLLRARKAGVHHIVSVSESCDDAKDILDLACLSDGLIWPGLGLHPIQGARSVTMQEYERFEPMLKKAIMEKAICCVGEIGLDFSPHVIGEDRSSVAEEAKKVQCEVFRRQVQLAVEANLAVNVHSRSAGHYALEILYSCGATKVNMHAFDGRASYAHKAVEAGFFFSVPPCTVRHPPRQALVAALPLSHLLLESDAPALGPEKGVNNEPDSTAISAAEIARIKGISIEEVIKQTTANAMSIFDNFAKLVEEA